MERVTSAEDVKWCIGSGTQQGISRNGSELGLQEIFKELSSFPSVSSYLAQLGESTSTAMNEDKITPPPFSTIEEGQTLPIATATEAAGHPTAPLPCLQTADAFSRGIARVPSLEVLKMFLGPSNALYSQTLPLTRVPPTHETQSGSSVLGGASSLNGVAASVALPQGGVIPPAPQSAILSMNPAAAAAALQFSQFSSTGLIPQSLDMELLEKSEQRRARRMLSNRESARRSRKRKQEHLHTLEEEIRSLQDEKGEWLESRENLTRRCQTAEEECARLKEENLRLRDELSILGLVKSELFQSRKRFAAENEKESEK